MSLWDTPSSEDPPNNNAVVELGPQEMVVQELNTEQNLEVDKEDLLKGLLLSCSLTDAAFKITEFTPNLESSEESFWSTKVIPTIISSLEEDIKARNAIVQAVSSVRNLAIAIQKSGEIVKQTKGSKQAIAIAKKNIPDALAVLDRAIEVTSGLTNSAVNLFRDHASTFMKIIGPKAADFVKQKEDIEVQITHWETKRKGLTEELSHLKGETERFSHLVHVMEVRLRGSEAALKDTHARTNQMQQLNTEADNAIKAIPQMIDRTETHTTRGWFFLLRSHTTVTVTKVENPDRVAQQNYYSSIISAREQRIKETQQDAKNKEDTIQKLNEELAKYKESYNQSFVKYQQAISSFDSELAPIQSQIDTLWKKMKEIDDTAALVEGKFQLKGNVLIDCLVAINSFNRVQHGNAKIYAPIVGILTAIKSMVQADVDLLGGDDTCVFIAGNRLLKQVGYLTAFSAATRGIISDTQKSNSHAIAASVQSKQITN